VRAARAILLAALGFCFAFGFAAPAQALPLERAGAAPNPAALEQQVAHPRLLRAQTDVFVVQGRLRRWVVSPQVFADYRFQEAWVETISEGELTSVPRGPDLVAGPVLRAPAGDLWIVYQGTRRRVIGPDAFAPLYLSPADAQPADEGTLQSYPIARSVGNPPYPWLVLVLPLFLAVFSWQWWCAGRLPECGGITPLWRSPVLWAVAAAVVALRLYYVTLFPWLPDGADGPSYVGVARSLLATRSLFDDGPATGLTHITSPLYPLLLAATGWAVTVARGSVVGWKVLQVGASLLLVPLVADLAARLCGSRTAIVAALIALLCPLWFYSAELLQYELWLGLLLVAGVWALVRARLSPGHSVRWSAAAGLFYGLAVLMQLKTAVVLPPAALFLLWPRQDQVAAISGRLRVVVLFSALALLPSSLWAARNQIAHGEPILGSTGGGALIWMGARPGATGGYMQLPRPPAFYERIERYAQGSTRSREARAYADLAWDAIAGNPAHFAVLGLTKLERFWWTITPERLGEYLEGRTTAFSGYQVDGVAQLLFSKLLHLAAVGSALAGVLWGAKIVRVHQPERGLVPAGRWLLVATIGLFWVSHVPFIAEPRYRIPVEPLLHVLQGAGLIVARDAIGRLIGTGGADDQTD